MMIPPSQKGLVVTQDYFHDTAVGVMMFACEIFFLWQSTHSAREAERDRREEKCAIYPIMVDLFFSSWFGCQQKERYPKDPQPRTRRPFELSTFNFDHLRVQQNIQSLKTQHFFRCCNLVTTTNNNNGQLQLHTIAGDPTTFAFLCNIS
jgi:hypothetical protein